MATKELPSSADQDGIPQSFSKNFDQTGNSPGLSSMSTLSTAIAANGKTKHRAPAPKGPLSPEMLDKMNRYWRAANYLCIGQIYLFENPLAARAAQGGTDQTAIARPLGNFAGAKPHLHSSESPHQRA
jgi:hypothetical protein